MSLARSLFDSAVKPSYVLVRDSMNTALERRHGIETRGVIGLEQLGLAGPDRRQYMPAEWTMLPRILPRREVGPEDVFIDFGSGLGRVVYQAALRYPIKRVIGVELSEELNEIARRNIERNHARLRCPDVRLVTADALDYEIPDDVTVAFFFNPFIGATFAGVIDRLLDTLDARPRRLRLIYRNPVEDAYLRGTARFRPVRRLRGLRPDAEWSRSKSTVMYEALPRARHGGSAVRRTAGRSAVT
jgi:Histone methylation protein DOT1